MKKKILIFIIALILMALGFLSYKIIDHYMYPTTYIDYVSKYSKDSGLPKSLVFAVIHTESSFNPNAESDIGARGLMQITEDTFEWVKFRMNDTETTYDDLYDPETNIKYGSWLLKLLKDEFKTTNNTLCAYHAGWGATKSWLSSAEYAPDGKNITNIPYKDTRHHVYKVDKAIEKYKDILNED